MQAVFVLLPHACIYVKLPQETAEEVYMGRSRVTRKARTPFGKLCAKHRIDKEKNQLEQARHLGFSVAYVALMEFGRRNVPDSYCERFAKWLGLSDHELSELLQAAWSSRTTIKIVAKTPETRLLASAIARHINNLTPEQMREIEKLLDSADAEPPIPA